MRILKELLLGAGLFQRGYEQHATDEFLGIVRGSSRPEICHLTAEDGEHIDGCFYREELVPCSNPGNIYTVQHILCERTYHG